MSSLDEKILGTNHPNLRSWLESANDPATHFPVQNLPVCVCMDEGHNVFAGVRIGDQVADVQMLFEANALTELGDFTDLLELALEKEDWGMLAIGKPEFPQRFRVSIQQFFLDGPSGGQQARRLRANCLTPANKVEFLEPVHVHNYTDFYASIHHATTVGSMFRPEMPLLPNYKHMPIGYHGRASSIVSTGMMIRRPKGQQKKDDAPNEPATPPTFGPCTMLDYELEVGAIIHRGNELGEPISIADARENIFGVCLVNDWSARDVQKWEYQPLGPFLAKNFATSLGECIVMRDALAPFRVPAFARPPGDPTPLPYLLDATDQASGGLDITLEVLIRSEKMRAANMPPMRVSLSRSFREMYWTFAQMIAHHTSNGCDLRAGDLLASGTVSGHEPGTRGCLLESTWAGRGGDGKPLPRTPIKLPTDETRTFLVDGDEVIMRGWCEREGFRTIGLGECRGIITPAT